MGVLSLAFISVGAKLYVCAYDPVDRGEDHTFLKRQRPLRVNSTALVLNETTPYIQGHNNCIFITYTRSCSCVYAIVETRLLFTPNNRW